MASEAGEFNLIVVEVESARLPDAAKAFGRAFGLDETIATQICKSAPIIFAQKLTKQEVKAITPTLGDLSKNGMEFRVTARIAGKLPKVNWPVRPQRSAATAPKRPRPRRLPRWPRARPSPSRLPSPRPTPASPTPRCPRPAR